MSILCDNCQRKTARICDHIAYCQDDLCKYFLQNVTYIEQDLTKFDHKPEGIMFDRPNGISSRENRKWDKGKLKYSLVIPEFLELMAEILTKGEINHPKEPDGTPSWQLVDRVAYEDALFRHLQARRKGEKIDPDPNMPTSHWGNIAVNAMFLYWFDQQGAK